MKLLPRLFFGFLLMVSPNWFWAQSDDNVTDTNPSFDEFQKKLDGEIFMVLKEKGIQAYLIALENFISIYAKKNPEKMHPNEIDFFILKGSMMHFVENIKFSEDYNQTDNKSEVFSILLSNLDADEKVDPALREAIKYQIKLYIALNNTDEAEKQKELEILVAINSKNPHPHLLRVIEISKSSLKNLKFKRDGKGKPVEIEFETLDGRKVDLSKMKGKVVLVEFWATWCGPCVSKLPTIRKIYDKFYNKGFEVVGISLDRDRKKLEIFVSENNIPWPQFFDGKGWKNRLAKKYGIRSIPTLWLVDKQRNLVDIKASNNLEEKVKKYLAQ